MTDNDTPDDMLPGNAKLLIADHSCRNGSPAVIVHRGGIITTDVWLDHEEAREVVPIDWVSFMAFLRPEGSPLKWVVKSATGNPSIGLRATPSSSMINLHGSIIVSGSIEVNADVIPEIAGRYINQARLRFITGDPGDPVAIELDSDIVKFKFYDSTAAVEWRLRHDF